MALNPRVTAAVICWCLLILSTSTLAYDAGTAPLRSDVVVIGGGSGGFGAAYAAARMDADVILLERADCLGGNSVRSGVNCWESGAGGTGLPFELYLRLKRQPGAVGIYSYGRHMIWYDPAKEPYRYPGGERVIDASRTYTDTLSRHGTRGLRADEQKCRELWHGIPFEPAAMAETMLQMLAETGHCRVLLNTAFVDANCDGNRITSIELSDGRRLVADYYIDATGDGTVCLRSGCQMMMGQDAQARFGEPDAPQEATGKINGVTLIYRVTKTDTPGIEPLPEGIPKKCWWRRRFPAASNNHYPNGDLNINMLPTMDGAQFLRMGYQRAHAECQRRIRAHWHYLQTNFAEFQDYRICWEAPALGIRESRRVVGEYVLTEHDLLQGLSRQLHDDIVCISDHSMDTHGSHTRASGELSQPYGVPYRCLIPAGKSNLLVACRAASFSSIAASSCRLSRTMMQLGQAAGTAAAIAHRQQLADLRNVPPKQLRQSLRDQHVQLEHPVPEELLQYMQNAER